MTQFIDVDGQLPKPTQPFQTPDIAKRAKQTAASISLLERVKFYRNLTIRVANALGVVEDAIEQWLLRIQEK